MQHRRRRTVAIIMLTGLSVGIALFCTGWWGGLRLNATPSYPLGFWRIAILTRPAAIGDRIFICLPPGPALELGRERGYLRGGLCPEGSSPLIKTITALPGQAVEVGDSVTIDGRPLPYSRVHSVDADGRALAAYAGGRVPSGHVFLHSDFPGSYDSRYFGPVPDAGILGLAEPVLTLRR